MPDANKFPGWMPKILVLAIVVAVGAGVALSRREKTVVEQPVVGNEGIEAVGNGTKGTEGTRESDESKESEESEDEEILVYKDGTYAVEGAYTSPGGPETFGVSLTVTDGIVSEAVVTPRATNPASVKFQTAFAEGYRPFVVGKPISDLSLSVVSGASLTTKGFNEALEAIRVQARS